MSDALRQGARTRDRELPTALNPDHGWYQDPDGGLGALQPRAHFTSDAPSLSLDGQWEFRSFADAECARRFCAWPDPLPSLGELAKVPAHWVLDRLGDESVHGKPWYTNVTYPFPVDPPYVPDQNPTAWYRRHFTVAGMTDRLTPAVNTQADTPSDRVILRLEGVESAYRVWIDGQWVGQAMGSRLTHEFDITDALGARGTSEDDHEIAVLVHQFSAGSYLEDQDQWWLPGIFRSVELLVQRPGDIWDLHLDGDWDVDSSTGLLHVQLDAEPQAFPVTVEIRPDNASPVSVVITDESRMDVVVPGARPWSPEDPALLDVELTTNTGATVQLQAGVRRVEIDDDGVLRANGDPLRFRGINRHEFHPERGRAVTVEDTRQDFTVMLEHHTNAVRTSHYPPAAHALALADEMGLWVVLESDLETHGYVQRDWVGNPCDDSAWRAAILDRTARMWHRDKNHPSVAMLSLGNESGTGANLRAAADWLHAHSSLPVHYEGDADMAYTDVYSRMYATSVEWEKLAAGTGHPTWGPATARRVARHPILLCEYAHAMGNGPGGLSDYERIFRQFPRACGGFAWEFKDQGLRVPAPGGGTRIAYGGDFGEQVHDGNFVLDGLCFADGTPSPGLAEFAAVVDPVWIERVGDGIRGRSGTLQIGNGYDHSVLEDAVVRVRRYSDAEESTVEHTLPPLRPGEWHTMELADAAPGERIDVEVRAAVVCGTQRGLRTRQDSWAGPLPGSAPVESTSDTDRWPDAVRGARLSVWRAPTDNDAGWIEPARERFGDDPRVDWDLWAGTDPRESVFGNGSNVVVSLAERWKIAGLDRLVPRRNATAEAVAEQPALISMWRPAGGPAAPWTGGLCLTWVEDDGAGILEAVIDLDDGPRLGRIGLELGLPVDPSGVVEWSGGGPGETAPDSLRSSRYGTWSRAATELTTAYPVPQSAGERHDLRHLHVPLAGGRVLDLEVLAVELDGQRASQGLWWSLSPWTDTELARATHADQLPDAGQSDRAWVLHLDAAYEGLGSRTCGVDVSPEARIEARRARIVVRVEGLQ
ncbi:glycoside hydrolase family 2 TIM barrel-domain containing protein [Kocuria sp.]|uniref:glycoside hydrolase family 2 TIM barrel-domain containing protein n=1 Tax=Kocuria sp. TaxID=1871328 RepID=UPI0026DECA8C|nr:glycoside hydrolase family 2 TIM barrel-domain containing protein [Kocuria sp.]MDO5618921.1 glycoside hydrolase family 2 TIM barrel-domain containing protein [Kocuria sp.]